LTTLVKYEAACRALAEAKAVDEVKDLRDKADAMRIYAMQAKNKTLEVDAAEIRIRAERRLGEMISAQKENGGLSKGAAGSGVNQHSSKEVRSSVVTAPTLSDVGISKNLSSRAQKLAAVPAAEFEAEVGEWRERVQAEGARVTTRLEQAGERALKEAAEQAPPANDDRDEFGPSDSELAFLEEKAIADQQAYDALVEVAMSDDKLGEALKVVATQAEEIARLKAELRVMRESRDSQMNGKNEAIRMVKSLQKKLAKYEKVAA
jgi:hypothetical protein